MCRLLSILLVVFIANPACTEYVFNKTRDELLDMMDAYLDVYSSAWDNLWQKQNTIDYLMIYLEQIVSKSVTDESHNATDRDELTLHLESLGEKYDALNSQLESQEEDLAVKSELWIKSHQLWHMDEYEQYEFWNDTMEAKTTVEIVLKEIGSQYQFLIDDLRDRIETVHNEAALNMTMSIVDEKILPAFFKIDAEVLHPINSKISSVMWKSSWLLKEVIDELASTFSNAGDFEDVVTVIEKLQAGDETVTEEDIHVLNEGIRVLKEGKEQLFEEKLMALQSITLGVQAVIESVNVNHSEYDSVMNQLEALKLKYLTEKNELTSACYHTGVILPLTAIVESETTLRESLNEAILTLETHVIDESLKRGTILQEEIEREQSRTTQRFEKFTNALSEKMERLFATTC